MVIGLRRRAGATAAPRGLPGSRGRMGERSPSAGQNPAGPGRPRKEIPQTEPARPAGSCLRGAAQRGRCVTASPRGRTVADHDNQDGFWFAASGS